MCAVVFNFSIQQKTTMSYIVLHENETLEEAIKSRTKTATEPVECYKVIEERMTGSGRIEYWTFPMYSALNEEIVSGNALQHPHGEANLHIEPNGRVSLTNGFIHAYKNYEDALHFMEKTCVGYTETRPVIYKCVIQPGTEYMEAMNKHRAEDEPCPCYVTNHLKYVEPLTQRTWGRTKPFARMEKPENSKKKYGIIYDENQINGDVENSDE